MGYPLVLERPDICDITGYSITLYFFTPNPRLFGAAPTKFAISWSGEGKVGGALRSRFSRIYVVMYTVL
jgi:hypothetical protein